ncbi:MAG TPA: YigZ family protein [Firmicutes bacterium]|nr:YigZ family protein [Bacillota bacterium]
MLSEYLTVAKASEIVLIERKSKFIGRAKPVSTVEEAEEFIAEISKKHWDATHNVYAYVVGNQAEQQKCSDDGEPSGTSGLPTLEAIKSLDMVNVVVVTTRYFGGTLLGRGGLIRAYGGAAAEALRAAGIVRYVPHQRIKVTVDYTLMGKVQNELVNSGVIIHDTEYLAEVTFSVDVLPDQVDQIYRMLQEITADQFQWQPDVQVYHQIPVENLP